MRKAWVIPWDEIVLENELGQGSFGVVSQGKWRDISVAIKSIKDTYFVLGDADVLESVSAGLEKEISFLQQVRHANIVLFFGTGTTPQGTPFLVLELVQLGSLTDYLEKNPNIPWNLKQRFALDTATGMAYVHKINRIHRDLKSGNLLVSKSLNIKVSDFGTTTITRQRNNVKKIETTEFSNSIRLQRTGMFGTLMWMAPEDLQGEQTYGHKADVYSYGIVLWEIAAQRLPWEDLPDAYFIGNNPAFHDLLQEGRRPVVDAAWPTAYCQLMRQCWATQPNTRPEFSEARAIFFDSDEFKGSLG